MKIVLEMYVKVDGGCPYEEWHDSLDAQTASRIDRSVFRMKNGNFAGCKPIKNERVKGVFERTIDFGPGWRVYYGMDGNTVVVLLIGGNKKSQTSDIAKALGYWTDYKTRKETQS